MPQWLLWVLQAPQILLLLLVVGGATIVVPIMIRDEIRAARGGKKPLRGKAAREAEARQARRSRQNR